MDYEKKIEIPFGAYDSELKGWEYTIPEGMEAVIENGKVIVRQRESEDERIRQRLMWLLQQDICPFPEEEAAQMLNYLEKQKEAKWHPSESEMGVLYKLCYLSNQITDEDDTELTRLYQDLKQEYFNGHSFENMFSKEKQKEQKPILEVFGFKVGDAVRLKDGDGRKHIIKSFERVEGLHGPDFYRVLFEDNTAAVHIFTGSEYPDGYFTLMEKISEEKEQKPEVKDPFDDKQFCRGYNAGVNDAQKEQKPVECSKEDEVYLQDALWCVKQASKVARGENDMGACWSAERWLKSLRPPRKKE